MLCLYRDGRHEAAQINKSITANASKHGTVLPGTSGMIGKAGAPHHENKHSCPMFSGTVQVTQTHYEVRQKHSYIHEAAKRYNSNQRGEHICTVKYDVSSKISSHTSDSQNNLFSHNSDGTCNNRTQHGQHHKSGISEPFPTKQPQPSAEGLVEQKPNSSQIAECKSNVLDFVDWKQHPIDFVYHLPFVTDLIGYQPNDWDIFDEKENVAHLQFSFDESTHDSFNSRPVISDEKQPVHPCQNIKLEIKPDINTVKKEDNMDIRNRVGWSSVQPSPNGNTSLSMPEHHHCTEVKKEEKERNIMDMNRKDRNHRLAHKDDHKDHCKQEKGVSSTSRKISAHRDKFVWRSAVNGLKLRIWKERIAVPRKAVRNQPHAKRKRKVNLRAWFSARLPHLKFW